MALDFQPTLVGEFAIQKVVEPGDHRAAVTLQKRIDRTERVKWLGSGAGKAKWIGHGTYTYLPEASNEAPMFGQEAQKNNCHRLSQRPAAIPTKGRPASPVEGDEQRHSRTTTSGELFFPDGADS